MKTFFVFLCISVVLIVTTPNLLLCQEISVALDTNNKILVIDHELEKTLNLYPEYNIKEIRLFKFSETSYVLELSYDINGTLSRKRINMNQSEVNALRNKVTELVSIHSPQSFYNQDGRSEFLWGTTLMSLGYWGWAVPYVLGMDGTGAAGMYLISAGAGFFIPYMLTQNTNLTKGTARFSIYGGYTGLGHGALLGLLLLDNPDFRTTLTIMSLTSIAEMIVNYNIAKNYNFTLGRAGGISNFTSFFSFYGMLTPLLFDDVSTKGWALSTLLSTGVGYGVGAIMARDGHYGDGDPAILANCGFFGAALPLSIFALTANNKLDGKLVVGTTIFSSLAGLVIGDILTRKVDFSESQGTYLSLGTLGGALIGGGIGLLISSGDQNGDTYRAIPLLALAGGTAGFSILYNYFYDNARVGKTTNNFDIQINPAGLASGLFNKTPLPVPIPVVNLSYKF